MSYTDFAYCTCLEFDPELFLWASLQSCVYFSCGSKSLWKKPVKVIVKESRTKTEPRPRVTWIMLKMSRGAKTQHTYFCVAAQYFTHLVMVKAETIAFSTLTKK